MPDIALDAPAPEVPVLDNLDTPASGAPVFDDLNTPSRAPVLDDLNIPPPSLSELDTPVLGDLGVEPGTVSAPPELGSLGFDPDNLDNLRQPPAAGPPKLGDLGFAPEDPKGQRQPSPVVALKVATAEVGRGVLISTTGAMGMRIGATLGTPFFPPGGMILGGGLGLLIGAVIGDNAAENLLELATGTDVGQLFLIAKDDIAKDQQAMVLGVTAAAQAVGGTGRGMQIARKWYYNNTVAALSRMDHRGGIADTIITRMLRSPSTFFASESAAAYGGGMAVTGTAAVVGPDNPYTLMLAEIIGGVVTPGKLLAKLVPGAVDMGKRAFRAASGTSREHDVALIIQTHVRASGGDPETLAALLRAEDWDALGVTLTPAQKTGDDALVVWASDLGRNKATTRSHAAETAANAFEALRLMARAYAGSGDPKLIVKAAALRAAAVETALSAKLAQQADDLVTQVRAMSDDTPAERLRINKLFAASMNKIVTEWEDVAEVAWNAVKRDGSVEKVSSLAAEWDDQVRMMLDTTTAAFPGRAAVLEVLSIFKQKTAMRVDDLDPAAVRWGEGLKDRPAPGVDKKVTGTLIELRGDLLDMARAEGTPPKVARRLHRLADAVLDDLHVVLRDQGDDTYDFARELTSTGKRVLVDNFMGKQMNRGEYPADTLSRLLKGGDEQVTLHMELLDDVTEFMARPDFNLEKVGPAIAGVLGAQDRYVRLLADRLVEVRRDPATGIETSVVSKAKIETMLSSRGGLLERFPQVRVLLKQLLSDKIKADEFIKMARGETAQNNIAIFAKLSGTGNPSAVVEQRLFSLSSVLPENELLTLIEIAKGGPAGAVDGMVRVVFTAAMKNAMRGEALDFAAFRANLFEPIQETGQSLIDIMVKKGVVTEAAKAEWEKIFTVAARITKAQGSKALIDQPANIKLGLMTKLIRFMGAKVALAAGKLLGPLDAQGLQTASAGAQLSQAGMMNNPAAKFLDLLHRATNDPGLMALMLERPTTPRRNYELIENIHAYALFSGFSFFRDGQEKDRKGFVRAPVN